MGHREDERYYIFSRLLKGIYSFIFSFKLFFFFFFLKQTQTDINGGMALISLAALGSQIAMERVGHGRGPRCDITGRQACEK